MEAYAQEVNEFKKNVTIARSEVERLKEENAAYKKQNLKLTEELKAEEDDANERRDIDNRNEGTLAAYVGGDVDQLKAKVK